MQKEEIMINNILKGCVFAGIALCLMQVTGCASDINIPLSSEFWKKPESIAVVKTPVFKPQFYIVGTNQGLIEVIIENIATKQFQGYLKTLNTSWYQNLKSNFIQKLKQKNINVKDIKNDIDISRLDYFNKDLNQYAKYNYEFLRKRYNRSKLLLISLNAVGAIRSYRAFIPVSAPKAYISLEGHLVNLKNNRILWRYTATSKIALKGKWDQTSNHSNFTRAYKVAVKRASKELMANFFKRPERDAVRKTN